MKKLLLTTALTFVAFGSAASAQSVLERVLGQIDNSTNLASVNGTFANIAENIGGGTTTNYMSANGDIISASQYESGLATQIDSANLLIKKNPAASPTAGEEFFFDADNDNIVDAGETKAATIGAVANLVETAVTSSYADSFTAFQVSDGGINGSITNVIDGITDVTQQATAGTVTAIEYNMPTFDFGDMATTALGAVNTGEITLGVNSSVDNAKTSTTEALSSVMTQMGGSADTGALVLNVASNMTGINGSINNTMQEINGSMGNLSTTALGAVNTGTIISGVNAAVNGITGASAGQ